MNPTTPKSPHPYRILLVDDHAVVRHGTQEMLNRNPEFQVVGEAESGAELAGLIRLRAPHLILMDISLPGQNGLQLLEQVKTEFPELKVILFSAHAELQYVRRAQALKADGYLSKTISETELHHAILTVLSNGATPVYSQDLREKIQESERRDKESRLTAREYEILQHLSQGLTNQEMAQNLCLSVKTVDTHVANLMKKTGVNKRTQLLAYAYEQGLIES